MMFDSVMLAWPSRIDVLTLVRRFLIQDTPAHMVKALSDFARGPQIAQIPMIAPATIGPINLPLPIRKNQSAMPIVVLGSLALALTCLFVALVMV